MQPGSRSLPVAIPVSSSMYPAIPVRLIGPYISQFLWLDIPYGIKTIDQRYRFPSRNQRFLTDFAAWLACQRGAQPAAKLQFDSEPRYICSNREIAEYVHQDFSFQSYL